MRVADASDPLATSNGAPQRTLRQLVGSRGARQGLLALTDQCLASGTTFLTMAIIARACTQAEVGIYSLCYSIVLFAVVMQERTLSAPYLVFSHQAEGPHAASLLGSTLVHQAVLALLVTVAQLGYFAFLVARDGFSTMAVSVLAIALVTLPLLLREFIRTVSFAHLRISGALLVDGVVAVLQLGGLATLAAIGVLTIPKAFFTMGAACVLASFVWFLARRHPVAVRRDRVGPDWRRHWGYARWLVYGRLLGNGSRLFMPWIVAAMLGLAQAGVFASCVTLAGLAWVFVRGINNLMQPRAVRAYHRQGKQALVRELVRCAMLYLVFLGAMILVFFFAGSWLLALVFGPDFTDGAPALALLGVNVLATGLAMTSSNGLAAIERPKANFTGEAATFLVTVLPAVPLIQAFGITGAAVAMVAGAAASLVVMTWALSRELQRVDTLH